MPQLRHVLFTTLELPDPPSSHGIVLANLQTLSCIYDFKCNEEVVKRIPNIRKLGVRMKSKSLRFLNNLDRLNKLESLQVGGQRLYDPKNMRSCLEKNLILPHSLKKLTLYFTHLHWEDLTMKLGSLPSLEVLKLRNDAFVGPEWKTVEGNFCSLKVLLIEDCDLECWTTDDTHFPRLEPLVLLHLEKLREIPSNIGDVPTPELIELRCCGDLANDSAERIQEELGNEDLQVYIW